MEQGWRQMKRKSIGKLAIVALLSVAILLSFTVCSKKAETKTTTTTTATSAPATTAPATTPAATAPVQEEKKAEVPAAEPTPAPVVEPVVEEPAPVVETVAEEPAPVEEPAVEEVKEDLPVYSTLVSSNGITVAFVAYNDHATVTIPSGIDADKIKSAADYVLSVYPAAASLPYTFDGNVLEISYPAQSDDVIVGIVSSLADAVTKAIDSYYAAKEEVVESKEFSVAADGTINATYSYKDLAEADVVLADGVATIKYPAHYIYRSDIDEFVAAAVAQYPALAQYVTYSVPEDGTLVVTYPASLTTSHLVEALAVLNDKVTVYIDNFITSYLKAFEPAEEAPAVVEEAPAIEVPAFSTLITTHGLTATVEAYADKAYITVPAGTAKGDVDAVVGLLAKAYPELASAVVYSFDGSVVTLQYPAQSDAVIRAAVSELNTLAVAAADQFFGKEEAKAEVVVEEAPAVVEEVPVAEAPKSETEAPVAPVTPVAEIKPVDTIKKFEVGVAARPALNFTYESPFFADIEARFAVNVTPTIALGAKVGFGLDGYIPLKAYGEYNFTENLYAFAEAGAEFGIAANQGKTVPVIGLGVGYEKAITDNISIFGEAGVEFKIGYEKPVVPGLTIGAKMAF